MQANHALTDGVGAVEMAMALYDPTAQYEQRPLPKEPTRVAARPLGGFRDVLSYEAGLVGKALAGPLKAAPGLVVDVIRHPVRTVASGVSLN